MSNPNPFEDHKPADANLDKEQAVNKTSELFLDELHPMPGRKAEATTSAEKPAEVAETSDTTKLSDSASDAPKGAKPEEVIGSINTKASNEAFMSVLATNYPETYEALQVFQKGYVEAKKQEDELKKLLSA